MFLAPGPDLLPPHHKTEVCFHLWLTHSVLLAALLSREPCPRAESKEPRTVSYENRNWVAWGWKHPALRELLSLPLRLKHEQWSSPEKFKSTHYLLLLFLGLQNFGVCLFWPCVTTSSSYSPCLFPFPFAEAKYKLPGRKCLEEAWPHPGIQKKNCLWQKGNGPKEVASWSKQTEP